MVSSSSSKRRCAAIGSGLYPLAARSGAELAQLAVDLGLDVQRLAAAGNQAVVASDHELADLVAQARVDDGRREPRQLGLDVDRGLAAGLAAVVGGGEELADLVVSLAQGARAARRRGRGWGSSLMESPPRPIWS